MSVIRGTNRADDLDDTAGNDTIYGRGGDDAIYGGNGSDQIFGGDGDDRIFVWDADDTARGGRGNDYFEIGSGRAFGGLGNDTIVANGLAWDEHGQVHTDPGFLVGGWGDDSLNGKGVMYGDGGPKDGPLIAGNDAFFADMGSTMTGGGGADTFHSYMYLPGYEKVNTITDFQAGVDKVGIDLSYGEGVPGLTSGQLWGIFDTNGDGILNGTDTPWDANSQTYADPANNNLILRLHDEYVVIHGTTAITAGDWIFS